MDTTTMTTATNGRADVGPAVGNAPDARPTTDARPVTFVRPRTVARSGPIVAPLSAAPLSA